MRIPDLDWLVEDWSSLDVPVGWEAIAELCRRVGRRSDQVVHAIVTRIREELPEYRSEVPVSTADLRMSVRSNVVMMLRGTAERRGPTAAELEIRRELGVRRADQGLAVNMLLQAFVVGYRELWNNLLRESRSDAPEVRDLLLSAAATIWEWVHEVTNAVGTAYHERIRQSAVQTSARRERLFDCLLGGGHDEDEVRAIAHSLGFHAQRRFRALAASVEAGDSALVANVNTRLCAISSQQHAVRRGDALLVLAQDSGLERLLRMLKDVLGEVAIGVGATRQGLHGAALSLGDAERALAVARRSNRVADFERDWQSAMVVASEHRLTDLLTPGITQARQHPELARTVRAFADSRFSMSETARQLHVHTNTVAYRLARWTELTSWDPRTYDGLLRSIAAFVLADGVSLD
ncbi:PucR family transcriptional regulator [Nonomuraea sp. M3C6]|uniref:PucR family transcriptional regulator n=1 Tax=Nonomuraea marmarensis TaxID=3351344 RepID=A0ABW7AV81_9ACTN